MTQNVNRDNESSLAAVDIVRIYEERSGFKGTKTRIQARTIRVALKSDTAVPPVAGGAAGEPTCS